MNNKSPIIYLSLREDGNISIATHTPAKYVPTGVSENDAEDDAQDETGAGGCFFPDWLPDGTGASLSVLEIAGMAIAVLAGLATWGFVVCNS